MPMRYKIDWEYSIHSAPEERVIVHVNALYIIEGPVDCPGGPVRLLDNCWPGLLRLIWDDVKDSFPNVDAFPDFIALLYEDVLTMDYHIHSMTK
eukprot:gene926-1134_t